MAILFAPPKHILCLSNPFLLAGHFNLIPPPEPSEQVMPSGRPGFLLLSVFDFSPSHSPFNARLLAGTASWERHLKSSDE